MPTEAENKLVDSFFEWSFLAWIQVPFYARMKIECTTLVYEKHSHFYSFEQRLPLYVIRAKFEYIEEMWHQPLDSIRVNSTLFSSSIHIQERLDLLISWSVLNKGLIKYYCGQHRGSLSKHFNILSIYLVIAGSNGISFCAHYTELYILHSAIARVNDEIWCQQRWQWIIYTSTYLAEHTLWLNIQSELTI